MSECENCDGTGWYLTPPLECRDGKYRKTRCKCSCGGKTMAFETTICQECPTPIQWPGLRAAYLRCINIALDARDSMLAERDTTIDRLTRENEDLRAKLEDAEKERGELAEAVRVMAKEIDAAWKWDAADPWARGDTWDNATAAAVNLNPIAAAAVKEAGGG